MHHDLQFGVDSIRITVPDKAWQGGFRGPAGRSLFDVRGAIALGVEDPLDAPALKRAFTPDDRVAVVVDGGLPDAEAILEPVVACLLSANVAAPAITVVCTPPANAALRDLLQQALAAQAPGINVVLHDAADAASHAYLASTQAGNRVYLNRLVVDSDAHLVVGRAGFDPLLGIRGTTGELYPAVSNEQTWHRCRQLAIESRLPPRQARDRIGCDEVGWLSGLFYAVAVALDRNNQAEAAWVGQHQSVQRAAEAWIAEAWTVQQPVRPPHLVVAAVAPRTGPASWLAAGAALEAASRLVATDGSILLIADLADPPGPTGRWLADDDNPWNVLARLRSAGPQDGADTLETALLAKALATHKVHLFSRLESDLVESLSMVAVGSPREVDNLVARSPATFVLEDADWAYVAARAPKRSG